MGDGGIKKYNSIDRYRLKNIHFSPQLYVCEISIVWSHESSELVFRIGIIKGNFPYPKIHSMKMYERMEGGTDVRFLYTGSRGE